MPHKHACKNCVAALSAMVMRTNIRRTVHWEIQSGEAAHFGFNAGPKERR